MCPVAIVGYPVKVYDYGELSADVLYPSSGCLCLLIEPEIWLWRRVRLPIICKVLVTVLGTFYRSLTEVYLCDFSDRI